MLLSMKLIWRELSANKARMAVSVSAIFISVALIVWMMGSYDTMVKGFDDDAETYMGQYDLCVIPVSNQNGRPPTGFAVSDLAQRLAVFPCVETVSPVCQVPRLQIGCDNKRGSFDQQTLDRMGIPPQSPVLVGSQAVTSPFEMIQGVWPNMRDTTELIGVLGSASAEYFEAQLGTIMQVRVGARVYGIKVVGIVKQAKATPGVIMRGNTGGPAFAALFVPQRVCEHITGKPFTPNLIYVRLKEGVAEQDFAQIAQKTLTDAGAGIADTRSVIQRLKADRAVVTQKENARMAVLLVSISCMFIIFTTLSIGVTQRIRKLALMRALGMSRIQVAGLVFGEALILALPALIAGLLTGYGFIGLLQLNGTDGLVIQAASVWIAVACAVGGALLAAIYPAWQAARQAPLQVTTQVNMPMPTANNVWYLLFGILCLCIQPGALYVPGIEIETRKTLFFWIGYPGLFFGILFLAPWCVRIMEQCIGYLLSTLLRVPYVFLKLQLTRNLSRTVGAVVSIAVGLTLFIGVQIWGYSMLVPFLPDSTTPNTLVSFLHIRLHNQDVSALKKIPSLYNADMHPIYVDEPDISPAQMQSPDFKHLRNRSIVLAGIPVDAMTQGAHAAFRPVFVEGDSQQAYEQLKTTRSLLIPDTFARETNLHPGDDLYLVVPDTRGSKQGSRMGEPWKIAGVISYPGWHWLTKTSGMRVRRGGFVAALAIADECWLKRDFDHQSFQFLWGNTQKETSQANLQQELTDFIARKTQQDTHNKPLVKVLTRESLLNNVTARGDDVIFTMSQLPMIMMSIATLAILNVVLAGIQTRRKEMGLMRTVGVTSGLLTRMLLAETLLIMLCAIALSLGVGLLGAWCSIRILEYGYHFGIVTPSITMPWGHLLIAWLGMILLALIACWIPIYRLSKQTALKLLSYEQ